MSPSSLIFVAVVVSWIVYLVVHVARRREQLATARNVDRFSSQMRVLQRRAVANTSVQTPGRVTSTSLGVQHPLVAGAGHLAVEGHTVVPARPLTAAGPLVQRESASSITWQRAGAAVMCLAALTTLVSVVLAAFGMASWIIPAVSLAVAVFTAGRMRAAALSRKAARERAASARRRERAAAERAAAERERESRPSAGSMPVAQEYWAPHSQAQVFDVRALEESVEQAPALDPLFAEDGWQPTPVPPPTYTLKAKAYRPLPPPAATTEKPAPIEDEQPAASWREDDRRARSKGA